MDLTDCNHHGPRFPVTFHRSLSFTDELRLTYSLDLIPVLASKNSARTLPSLPPSTHRHSRWPRRCRWRACRASGCSSPPRCPRSGCPPAQWGRDPPDTAPDTGCSRSGCPTRCPRSISCSHCLKYANLIWIQYWIWINDRLSSILVFSDFWVSAVSRVRFNIAKYEYELGWQCKVNNIHSSFPLSIKNELSRQAKPINCRALNKNFLELEQDSQFVLNLLVK